jgi:O-antigen/teichoic acid export membrane protein
VTETINDNTKDSSVLKNKSSFAVDVLTLVSGTTFAQILTILATPILTRLYGPEDFGLLTLFLSITGIFGIIICLRYELSIMLPESDEEAANLLGLSLVIALILSILTIPFIWFYTPSIQNTFKAPQLGAYLWFVPFFIFISGVFLALNYWNTRTKHFKRLSAARIIKSVATAGPQLGAGIAGYATGGSLIGANLVGQSVSTLILGGQIWKNDKSIFLRSISLKSMVTGLKRYRKFPLLDSWSALLNTVSWQLPVFLLAYFFSPMVVGFYSLGFRILQFPMSFIGNSISQVFFQRATEAKFEGTLAPLVENIFKLLVIIGMFPILTLTIVGSDVFSVIFGETWIEAGVYAQILSIWTFVWFISSPLSSLWVVLEKQEFGFKITSINLVTRILSLWIGGVLGNARTSLLLFSLSGVLVYGYLCIKMMMIAGVKFSEIINIIFSNFALCMPLCLILACIKYFEISKYVLIVISFLFMVGYYMYILKTNSQVNMLFNRSGMFNKLKRLI